MNRLSNALLALGLSASFSLSLAAGAPQAAAPVPLSIEAQPLENALQNFAKQSGLQVIFATELTRDLIAPAVEGSFTPEAALQLLLKDSKLRFEFVNERTVRISDDRSASADSVELEEVLVRGVRFYQPEAGNAASKMDLPLLETPLSVSIVTSEQIEARAADSLEQAFRYTPGIYSLAGGANRRATTAFTARGFNITGAAPLYINGSKFPINSTSGAVEPYLYESVEFLKGPASVLYGQATPGGVLNMVSKRPTSRPLRSIKLQAGSWDHRQLNADFGGPLTDDGAWGYRLTGIVRESDTMVDGIPDDRAVVSSAITWRPSSSTSLTLLASYSKTETADDTGKPFDGTVLPNINGKVSRERFLGEPGFDKFNPTGRTFGYLFEHRFNDVWQVRQNVLSYDYDVDFAGVGLFPSTTDVATQRVASRYAYTRKDSDKGASIDNQLLGKWVFSRFENSVLFGVDYSERKFDRSQSTLFPSPSLDLYSPVYGQPFTMPAGFRDQSDSHQLGVYLQDHLKFDQRWILMAGGRWDDSKSDNTYTTATGVAIPSEIEASAFTKRIGLLYLSANGLAPYLSYSESFQPTEGADINGSRFDPTQGEQYEAGLKFEPKGRNAALTLAVYQLTQENVLTADPLTPANSIQTGEIRSRGVEAEGRVAFGESLDLIASYNYTDAEVTRSNDGNVGFRPASVPRDTASLWVDYHYRVMRGEASLGIGARYVGESTNFANSLTVPDFIDYDLSARFDLKQWRFALNVKNLFDKTYVSACTFACFYGDARNVTVSAQYNW